MCEYRNGTRSGFRPGLREMCPQSLFFWISNVGPNSAAWQATRIMDFGKRRQRLVRRQKVACLTHTYPDHRVAP